MKCLRRVWVLNCLIAVVLMGINPYVGSMASVSIVCIFIQIIFYIVARGQSKKINELLKTSEVSSLVMLQFKSTVTVLPIINIIVSSVIYLMASIGLGVLAKNSAFSLGIHTGISTNILSALGMLFQTLGMIGFFSSIRKFKI